MAAVRSFCIPLPGNSSKCTCPDGQRLANDERSCVDDPPQEPPVIHGFSKDTLYQEGQSLNLTCSVYEGKPLVASVLFSCGPHLDSSPDNFGPSKVDSVLSINALTMEDEGLTCVCVASWKDTDWYKLSDMAVLRVNGPGRFEAPHVRRPRTPGGPPRQKAPHL
ncbi:hypothetical protein ACOMHN_046029 [Nucella lapillus]